MPSRSRSASLVHRNRKFLLPLGLETRVVDEPAVVGFAHAFLDGADLPFVEFHELPHRFRGQSCAAALSGLGEPVEALTGRGVEPEGHGFSHSRLLCTMYTFCAPGCRASTQQP